jgi:hypothetical protein
MAKHDRGSCRLEDGEGNLFDAVWSRSGKHLIVSVVRRGAWDSAGQVELAPEQLVELRRFIDSSIGLIERER